VLCLVRPAAEEYEIVRRMDSYRRTKDRPGTGVGTRTPDLSPRPPSASGRNA
jgi:hypothetical protein